MKRAFVKSYGCQMNVYDSERMGDLLTGIGYELVDSAQDCDLVLLNTCHIREKAAEKVYSELGKLKKIKKKRGAVIAVTGCVAQAEGEEIIRRAPIVDLVLGPQTYHRLPELLKEQELTGKSIVAADFPAEAKFDHLAKVKRKQGVTAFLTVQEGCDKFCTFCVVPYTRGAEFSRPVKQLVEEARALVDSGVREITLLGQNVNAYRGLGLDGDWSLARLIDRLAEIDGLKRLRFTTSHPRDMSPDLIDCLGENEKLMPYLHLPIQSGSDKILKAMNRTHTQRDYLRIIENIRTKRADIAISGDFIVGFPGETENDFKSTLSVVREVSYASAFSFKYSPRPGTPAAAMALQIEDEVKSQRLTRLQALLAEQQHAFNDACIGMTMEILLERPGRHPGQLVGRSPYLQSVFLDAGQCHIGDMVSVVIDGVGSNSLSAHTRNTESVILERRNIEASEGAAPLLNPRVSAREIAGARPGQLLEDRDNTTLVFDDNRLLAPLFGEHDEHLALIEHRLGVAITPRGNRISVKGPQIARDAAQSVLSALYDKVRRGQEVTRGDVEGAIRMHQSSDAGADEGSVKTRRKLVSPRTPTQKEYVTAIRTNEMVFGTGPAGTGKTYLAVACAAAALMNGEVDRIILSRPAVEAGERLGFLPGDMKEKVDPYLRPLYDALYDMMPAGLIQKGLAENTIEIAPLAFMRGRTLAHSFIILDEAQNTTPPQMKMFLTRLGEGSRMVVTGDPSQVDLPQGVTSGLQDALAVLKGVGGISHIVFTAADIVRHALVGRIVTAYDKKARAKTPR